MIDFKKFEEYVEARKNKKFFILKEKLITSEEVTKIRNLIKKHGATHVLESCQQAGKEISLDKFCVEIKCKGCGDIFEDRMGKNALSDYIRDKEPRFKSDQVQYPCPKCHRNQKNKEKIDQQEYNERRKQRVIDDTKKYIEVYLDPQNKWNKESKNRQKMDQIRIGYEDVDEIANHIKSLDYYDFLETPYWKAIAEYTKLKASFR